MNNYLAAPLIADAGEIAPNKIVTIYGTGTVSCGKLVQDIRGNPQAIKHYETWLGGYITAYSVYTSPTGVVGNDTDLQALMEWVHTYCQKNPTQIVAAAAIKLIIFQSEK